MTLSHRCNAKTYFMFISATHLISWQNFSITGELLNNLWGETGSKGSLGSGFTSRGNMSSAPGCNTKSYSMVISATHLNSWQNFSITGELLNNLWGETGSKGSLGSGFTSRDNMSSAPRCNTKSYFMFISATQLISWQNFSVTGERLTYLWGETGSKGSLGSGVTSRGNMTLSHRCNIKTYFMLISATQLISWQNFSITGELLNNLWGETGSRGPLGSGFTSRGNISSAPRCNTKSYFMFISATQLISWQNFSITGELLTYLWGETGSKGSLGSGVTSRGNMTLSHRCNIKTYFMLISATQLISWQNFSITGELLTYLWGETGSKGSLGSGVSSRGNITLAPGYNTKSYSMVISATQLISWQNFSITGELLNNLWGETGSKGSLGSGFTSRGNMFSAPGCNTKSYSMFISATHLLSWPNFSITDDLLTYLCVETGSKGSLGSGVTSRGNMTLSHRCNIKTYFMLISPTHLMSWLNFSVTDEHLTYLWGETGSKGSLGSGVKSRGNITLAPGCNTKSYFIFISTTHMMSWLNFSVTDELLTYVWGDIDTRRYLSSGFLSMDNMTIAPRFNA